MTTAQAALDYLLTSIAHAEDTDLLTDILTRLGTVCGARPDPDSLLLLAKFEGALRLERGQRKLLEAIGRAVKF